MFPHLFHKAVRDGSILASAVSSDNGVYHAEQRLFESLLVQEITIEPNDILYTTVEPCSVRTTESGPADDVTQIITAAVKNLVFAVASPTYGGEEARTRLSEAGVSWRQLNDARMVEEIAITFNNTLDTKNPAVDSKPTSLISTVLLLGTQFPTLFG